MLYSVKEMVAIANDTFTEYQNELVKNPENAVYTEENVKGKKPLNKRRKTQ